MLSATLVLLLLIQAASPPPEPSDQPSHARERGKWPCRLGVPRSLVPGIDELWRSSPTFRRQCVRIAEADVTVAMGLAPLRTRGARALSHILRRDKRVFYASVILRDDRFLSEDVPHELEHVLEQIEGQDLEAEVVAGRATWSNAMDAYETDRARKAGELARKEVRDSSRPGAPSAVVARATRE